MKTLGRILKRILKSLRRRRTIVDADKVLREVIALGVDPKDLEPRGYEEEIRYYHIMSEREWKRLSMTQAK